MALQITPNPRATGTLSIAANSRARMSSVLSIDWDHVTDKPPYVEVDTSDSANISFIQAGTGAVTRTAQSKERESVTFEDFGAVGDGTTDDTAAVQRTIDYVAAIDRPFRIKMLGSVYRLTSPINVLEAQGLEIDGSGVAPYNNFPGFGYLLANGKGGGSWFYIAHTGKGFNVVPTSPYYVSGLVFRGLGTYRDQPTPGVGWAPTAHDYDFYFERSSVEFNNVCLLNATKGIDFTNSSGILRIKGLTGQPMQIGVQVDEVMQIPHIDGVDFWPFWATDANVFAYTVNNLRAINLKRVDNPQISNVFTYGHFAAISCTAGATGNASKIHATNIDCDLGTYGLLIDGGCDNVTGQFSNFTSYAPGGTLNTPVGVRVLGASAHLAFSNIDCEQFPTAAVSVEGASSVVTLNGFRAKNFNAAAGGSGAVYVAATARADINGHADTVDLGGNGTLFSGAGTGNYWAREGGQALTKVDDTNVTLTLGGSASTALVNAASISVVWAGTLANARLTNSSMTINGTSISLGASGTITAAPSGAAGGDLTGTYPNPTFAAVITGAGPIGTATAAPVITYDAKGRLTTVTTVTITPAIGSVTGLGTGVGAALAIAVGSAGGPVTFNGAGGTPSSMTATNLSGTAASLTAGTATNAVNSGITNDTTTNASMFLAWVTANTGNLPLKVTSTKLSFNPSTGALSSTSFTGAGTGLTGTAASLTAGSVTTNANLTGDVTSVGNATTLAAGNAGNLNSGTLLAARMPALTGDVTTSVGAVATAIGATKVTSAMLNADVYSTAHSWAGQQTFTAPILGAATATSINKVTITAPATSATLTLIDGTVLTGPAASGTAMTLGNAETVGGTKTFSAVQNFTAANNLFQVTGNQFAQILYNSSGTANQRRFAWNLNGTSLNLQAVDDTNSYTRGIVAFGFDGTLTLNGGLLYGKANQALVNGLNSNITLFNPIHRITGPTGAFSIGGFTAGADGKVLKVFNSTTQQMTIVNEDASSTAANRFKTLTGANVVLRAGTSAASFYYDNDELRWILLATN